MHSPREELLLLLRALNLGAIASAVEDMALRAAKEGVTHEAFLLELARIERAAKSARRIERLRKQSDLLPDETFRSFELNSFDPATRMQIERLRSGGFLTEAINVVAVGRPGAGKSHVACALGHALIEQGHPVLFASTSTLVQRLLAAKRDLRLPQELAKLDRVRVPDSGRHRLRSARPRRDGGALHAACREVRAQKRPDHDQFGVLGRRTDLQRPLDDIDRHRPCRASQRGTGLDGSRELPRQSCWR